MESGRQSKFIVPQRGGYSLRKIPPPQVHLLAYTTGGMQLLYERCKQKGMPLPEYGRFTNSSGHFSPELGMPPLALRYQYTETIGQGQSSLFIKAKDLFTHDWVAVKVLHTAFYELGAQEIDLIRRINLADPYNASSTLRMKNVFMYDDHFCMVFEYLVPKPLLGYFKQLDSDKLLPQIRKVAVRLVTALGFLQQENVIHADLKPENLLLAEDNVPSSLKVVDFGNAIHCVHDELSLYYEDFELQTLLYRAPEVMFGCPFSTEIDMWSVGCILAELYLGEPLFSGLSKSEVVSKMTHLLGPFPSHTFKTGKFFGELQGMCTTKDQFDGTLHIKQKLGESSDYLFSNFLAGLLRYNPDERFSPSQAAMHPFLAAEVPYRYLLPRHTQGFEKYSSVFLSSQHYHYAPEVSDSIRRQHLSSYEILQCGTKSAQDVPESYRKVAQVEPLKHEMVVTSVKNEMELDHSAAVSTDAELQSPDEESVTTSGTEEFSVLLGPTCIKQMRWLNPTRIGSSIDSADRGIVNPSSPGRLQGTLGNSHNSKGRGQKLKQVKSLKHRPSSRHNSDYRDLLRSINEQLSSETERISGCNSGVFNSCAGYDVASTNVEADYSSTTASFSQALGYEYSPVTGHTASSDDEYYSATSQDVNQELSTKVLVSGKHRCANLVKKRQNLQEKLSVLANRGERTGRVPQDNLQRWGADKGLVNRDQASPGNKYRNDELDTVAVTCDNNDSNLSNTAQLYNDRVISCENTSGKPHSNIPTDKMTASVGDNQQRTLCIQRARQGVSNGNISKKRLYRPVRKVDHGRVEKNKLCGSIRSTVECMSSAGVNEWTSHHSSSGRGEPHQRTDVSRKFLTTKPTASKSVKLSPKENSEVNGKVLSDPYAFVDDSPLRKRARRSLDFISPVASTSTCHQGIKRSASTSTCHQGIKRSPAREPSQAKSKEKLLPGTVIKMESLGETKLQHMPRRATELSSHTPGTVTLTCRKAALVAQERILRQTPEFMSTFLNRHLNVRNSFLHNQGKSAMKKKLTKAQRTESRKTPGKKGRRPSGEVTFVQSDDFGQSGDEIEFVTISPFTKGCGNDPAGLPSSGHGGKHFEETGFLGIQTEESSDDSLSSSGPDDDVLLLDC